MRKTSTADTAITFEAGAHLDRDTAMQELRAAAARILQPRGGCQLAPGMTHPHWLRMPTLPTVDRFDRHYAAQVEKCRAEELEIATEERRLEHLAQEARETLKTRLIPWSDNLFDREVALDEASKSGGLTEVDKADIAVVTRDHERFIRACAEWVERLRF